MSSGETKWVDVDNPDTSDALAMFSISETPTPQPILVDMDINGKQVVMNTGATVSIMSKGNFDSLFPRMQIALSAVELKTCTREAMEVVGKVKVCVSYQ